MTSSSAIQLFHEINDLYAAAQLKRTASTHDFDLIALETAPRLAAGRAPLGPHRRGFFQFTYLHGTGGGRDLLLAAAPGQVLKSAEYLRPTIPGQRGCTVLFKASLLGDQLNSPGNEFPFFYLPASLELPVPAEVRDQLLPQLRLLEAAATAPSPYRSQRTSALLAALLYDVRQIHEQAEATAGSQRLCTQLACRFDEVVLQHFRTHHTVGDYARLLHVSADHLSAEVKARSGRNARDIIAERLIIEASHLLVHTELNVGQIADQLGFGEPTHFTRFFKRHVQAAPLAFRQRMLRLPATRLRSEPVTSLRLAAM